MTPMKKGEITPPPKQRKMSVLAKLLSHNGEQDRRTPINLFNEINEEFHFELDPCTSTGKPNNLHTPYYFLFPKQDGLKEDWSKYKSVFVNPPFKYAHQWIKKCYEESKKGCTVVVLLPSKTETAWWHDYALKADEIRFIRRRVTFEGHENPFIIGMAFIIFKSL